MDFLKSVLGGGGRGNQQNERSLVDEWTAYSEHKDVEAGSSTTDTLFQAVDTAGTSVTGFLQASIASVQKGVTSGVSALPTSETFSIPTGQQLVYFFAFLAGGGVFLMLAFTIFLPTIILSPSKFAVSFTLGCLLVMAGFTQLRGWKTQMQHMMSKERIPFSAAYLASILATLYAAIVLHSYLMSLVCSAAQVVALLYYLMSYFPGGTQGVKVMLGLFYNAAMSCFGAAQRTLLK